jgi:hypothetical protein
MLGRSVNAAVYKFVGNKRTQTSSGQRFVPAGDGVGVAPQTSQEAADASATADPQHNARLAGAAAEQEAGQRAALEQAARHMAAGRDNGAGVGTVNVPAHEPQSREPGKPVDEPATPRWVKDILETALSFKEQLETLKAEYSTLALVAQVVQGDGFRTVLVDADQQFAFRVDEYEPQSNVGCVLPFTATSPDAMAVIMLNGAAHGMAFRSGANLYTASHCVPNSRGELSVYHQKYGTSVVDPAKIVEIFKISDGRHVDGLSYIPLSALGKAWNDMPSLKMAQPTGTTPVMVFGIEPGKPMTMSYGKMEPNGVHYSYTIPGMSGAPMLNQRGHVVGLHIGSASTTNQALPFTEKVLRAIREGSGGEYTTPEVFEPQGKKKRPKAKYSSQVGRFQDDGDFAVAGAYYQDWSDDRLRSEYYRASKKFVSGDWADEAEYADLVAEMQNRQLDQFDTEDWVYQAKLTHEEALELAQQAENFRLGRRQTAVKTASTQSVQEKVVLPTPVEPQGKNPPAGRQGQLRLPKETWNSLPKEEQETLKKANQIYQRATVPSSTSGTQSSQVGGSSSTSSQ